MDQIELGNLLLIRHTTGGISRDWYRLAYVRRSPAETCVGGNKGRGGMFPESCAWTASSSWQFPFAANTKQISTKLERIPVHNIGPATTMQPPGFVYAVVQGNTTGLKQRNCITVTLISNVPLTSGPNSFTRFTISGLETSTTASTETLDLYQNNKVCVGFGGNPTPGMGTYRSGALQSVEGVPTKDQAKFDKVKGTLEFQLQAGQYMQAGEMITFTFAVDNPDVVQDNQQLYISTNGYFCDGIGGLCSVSTAKQLVVSKALLKSTSNDPKTLRTEANTFVVRQIGQAHTTPDRDNFLYVTIMANKDIRCADSACLSKAVITLSGLGCLGNKVCFCLRVCGCEFMYVKEKQGQFVCPCIHV